MLVEKKTALLNIENKPNMKVAIDRDTGSELLPNATSISCARPALPVSLGEVQCCQKVYRRSLASGKVNYGPLLQWRGSVLHSWKVILHLRG